MFPGAGARSPPKFPPGAELGGVRWDPLAPLSNAVTRGAQDPTWTVWEQWEVPVQRESSQPVTVPRLQPHRRGAVRPGRGPCGARGQKLPGKSPLTLSGGFTSCPSQSPRKAAGDFHSH